MNPLPLATAERYAAKILDWLAPHCLRIEVAGSVRRRCRLVNDIDVVCIPKPLPKPLDLFGAEEAEPGNAVTAALAVLVKENIACWLRSTTGDERIQNRMVNPRNSNFLLHLDKCNLDVFLADAESWATRLLVRTGSKEHNIWIAERAKAKGLEMFGGLGLKRGFHLLQPKTEQSYYELLELPYIPPEEREMPGLAHRFDFQLSPEAGK
jgi:DNA polymerase/3'-5' exonuclease PolX